jgi:hypothetical protein
MILGFSKEIGGVPTYFKDKILIGTVTPYTPENQINSIKHHTIRMGESRLKEGDTIHFAYGVRTKDYECFLEAPCTHVTPIWIKRGEGLFQVQFYTRKGEEERELLPMLDVCQNDGLLISQFNDFFTKSVTEFPQKAHIIHWTKLRYERFI